MTKHKLQRSKYTTPWWEYSISDPRAMGRMNCSQSGSSTRNLIGEILERANCAINTRSCPGSSVPYIKYQILHLGTWCCINDIKQLSPTTRGQRGMPWGRLDYSPKLPRQKNWGSLLRRAAAWMDAKFWEPRQNIGQFNFYAHERAKRWRRIPSPIY